MKIAADVFIRRFLRTCREPFSAKEFAAILSHTGIRSSVDECEEYLQSNEYVFALQDGLFATRACIFTGQPFSFRPTRREIEKGVFFAGHRCMPFADPEMLPSALTFEYRGRALPTKEVDFDSDAAFDLFALYGEEFSVQYIAADPANGELDLAASDFMLPNNIRLTGFSLEPLTERGEFQCGDRLLCRVKDWDAGVISVSVLPHDGKPMQMNLQDVSRENWYAVLEQALLESFDLAGPCSSIEEQLAIVFLDRRAQLCVKNCGSVEELFGRSKRIGFEQFGVETRLWKIGEDVPAFGQWNYQETEDIRIRGGRLELAGDFNSVPYYLADAYIKDQLYRKEGDTEQLLTSLFPGAASLSASQRNKVLLHLNNRRAILSHKYNRFADYDIGEVRRDALEFFSEVNRLVYLIDVSDTDLALYPQQPLVILSQIFSHVLHIIELIESDPASAGRDICEIQLSLDGMEYNFENISDELESVIEDEKKNGFMIVKGASGN